MKAYRQGSVPPKKPKLNIKKKKTDMEKTVDDVKDARKLADKFTNDGTVMLEESKEPLPMGFRRGLSARQPPGGSPLSRRSNLLATS